jgi:hypothetical protein
MRIEASGIQCVPASDCRLQAEAFCAWFERLRNPQDLAFAFAWWSRSKGFGPTVRRRIAGEVSQLLRGEGAR